MANRTIEEMNFKIIIDDKEFDKQIKDATEKAKKLNLAISDYLKIKKGLGELSEKEYQSLKRLADLEARREVNAAKVATARQKTATEAAKTATQAAKQLTAEERLLAATERRRKSYSDMNGLLGRQSGIMRQLLTMAGTYVSLWGAKQIVESIVRTTAEFEKQRMALGAMLKDTQMAGAIFEQLKGLAVQSPFQFSELVTYAKQLSAYAIPINEIYETTKMLADVSAGVGVGMDRLVLAYGQVRSAEFLRGQEVRQFTEAGIPLLQELAKQFSVLEGRAVSVGEVFDKISRREVAFEMVKKVFTDMTSEGGKFYQMQEKLAQTLSGRLSNLADAWQIAMDEIGRSNSGMINSVVSGLYWMVNNYQSLLAVIQSLIVAYGVYRAEVLAAHAITWVQTIARQVTMLKQLHTNLSTANALLAIFAKNSRLAGAAASAAGGWIGLLVAAVAGIGVGIYKFATAESEAEKTTRKMNEAVEQGIANSENATAKIDSLFWALKNIKWGTQEYKNACDAIISQYGDKLSNIDLEKLKVGELADVYDKLNTAVTQEAKNSAYKAAMGVAEADAEKRKQSVLTGFKEQFPELEKWMMEYSRYIRNEIPTEGLNPKAAQALRDSFAFDDIMVARYEYKKILIDLQKQSQEVQENLDFIYGKGLKPNITPLKEWARAVQIVIHNASQSIKNSLKVDETTTWDSFFDSTTKRKAELQELIQKSQAVANKGESANVEAFKKELEYIEQIEDGLGVIFEKEKKNSTGGTRRIDKSDDYALRYAEELRKLQTQTEDIRRQTDIVGMVDGFRKQREQIMREYDNNIKVLADKQEEFRRKNFEFAEKMWKEGKGAKPVFADIELTKEQADYLEAMQAKYFAEKNKKIEDSYTNERNQWNDYLIEYGSFLQQKKAIEDKYNSQIAKTADSAEKMRLERQKQSALNRVDLNRTTGLIDWASISGEMRGVLAEQVRDALNALNAYIKSPEFKKASASDQKAVYDMIAKLRGAQVGGIGNMYDKYLKDFEKKLKEYNKLKQKEIDIYSNPDSTEAERAAISAETKNAEDGLVDSANNVQQAFDDLRTGIDLITQGIGQLNNGSLSSIYGGFKNIFDGLAKAGVKGMEGISNALSGKVGGIIGAILALIDSFAEKGIGGTFAGIFDKIGGAFQNITNDMWGDIGKFFSSFGNMFKDIFTSAVDGLVSAVTFGRINGLTNSNEKEVAETTKLLTDRNERLQRSIDNLTNKLDEVYGGSAVKAYDEALSDAKSIVENQMKLLQTQMGYHSMHHSNEYYWDLDEESYRAISRMLGKRIVSLSDIYKLTPEEMNRIRTSLIDIWDEMITQGKYDKSEYWNAYADLDGKIDELEKRLRENLLQTTFESIRTDFVDTLMDMNASVQDFSNDFTKLLQNAILNAQIGNMLDDQLKDWYDRLADALRKANGSLTQGEVSAFRKEYEDLVAQALEIRDKVAEITGYKGESTEGNVSTGISSITEDTANLLAAYINAVRADVSYAKLQREQMILKMDGIRDSMFPAPKLEDYLNRIQANTFDTAANTRDILAELRSVITTESGNTAIRTVL